jgi:hypothetical protein
MAMKRSTTLSGRLLALEQYRNGIIDRLFDRMTDRERVLLGARFDEYNNALLERRKPPEELRAIVRGDPTIQYLARAYWQLETWKGYAETTNPGIRRGDASG